MKTPIVSMFLYTPITDFDLERRKTVFAHGEGLSYDTILQKAKEQLSPEYTQSVDILFLELGVVTSPGERLAGRSWEQQRKFAGVAHVGEKLTVFLGSVVVYYPI